MNGKNKSVCVNGQWSSEVPECRLNYQKICTNKPNITVTNSSKIVSLSNSKVTIETDYSTSTSIDIYLTAAFACLPELKFVNQTKLTETKYYRGTLNKYLIVQYAVCLGNNQWENPPICQ